LQPEEPNVAKRVKPLSSAQVRNLKPGKTTIELVDGAVPGLRVRMTPGGVMTWSLNVRDRRGERRRFDVGRGLGLAVAREKAEELRRQIRQGSDPTAEKRATRARAKDAELGIGTFGSVVAAYFQSGPGSLLHSRAEQQRRIQGVFAKHLERPSVEISPAELQITADRHPSASAAGHAVAYARPLAAWASKRELMRSGFGALEKPTTRGDVDGEGTGQRTLSQAELHRILPSFGRRGHGAAARFMLYTACRLEEACGATWGEVDLQRGTWSIPASRRKDTRSKLRAKRVPQSDHTIPLPGQALELLKQIGPSENTSLIFRGDRGAKLQNWDRWTKSIASATGIVGWDRHTLRRTTATMSGQLGAPPHVISALLGHRNIGDQLIAGYSKARYTTEVGEILQRVSNQLEAIENA
jgi:integrase